MGGARAGRADKGTGKKQDIKITGASTLASDEVDRMVKDAEKFADEVRGAPGAQPMFALQTIETTSPPIP